MAVVESAFFDPSEREIIATLDRGSSINEDEIEVNHKLYQEAADVHYTEPFHIAIRRYLVGSVLRVPAEIKPGPDVESSPELLDFINKQWIAKQVPKIMGEGWILGLAPIELMTDPDTKWPIPYVYQRGLGVRYKITIRERQRRRGMQYRFYHIEREPGKRGQVKRSRKVIVYNGFDADPVQDTGQLTSVVVSLLGKQGAYDENYRLARVALMNMARPMVLLETTKNSQGMDTLRPDLRMPFYGGQDWLNEDRRERVAAAEVNLDVLARQQQAFWDQYHDQIEDMARSGSKSIHQAHLNMIPLPADHKSASYQRAAVRTDWSELSEIYEDIVTAAYGIQRAHLHSTLGRLQISETLTNAALVNVINQWRDDLSRVFTDLYRQAFNTTTGEIIFPKEVNDTPEGLYTKWERGILTWEGHNILLSNMTGIDMKYMREKEPPRPEPVPLKPIGKTTTEQKGKRKRDGST